MTDCLTQLQSTNHLDEDDFDHLVEVKMATLRQLCGVEIQTQYAKARVVKELKELHNQGMAPPVTSTLRKFGRVTTSHAEHQTSQAEALELVPLLERQLAPIPVDYLEITTAKLRKLEVHIRSQIADEWILAQIRCLTPDEYRRRLTRKIERLDADYRRKVSEQQWRNSQGSSWMNHRTGEGYVHTRFAPHEWEIATKAIEAEMKRLAAASGDEVSLDEQLFAQAHLNLLTAGSAPNGHGSWGNQQYQPKALIEIVADAETFAKQALSFESTLQTSMGTELPIETLQRHLCDSVIHKVLTDEAGIPISVGRKYRTATPAQRCAARSIYSTCAWADCQARFDWCNMHHIQEWENSGPTNFNNLIPLCNEHHHKVHEGKWTIKLNPDTRTLTHIQPNGKHWKTTGPPSRKPPPHNTFDEDLTHNKPHNKPHNEPHDKPHDEPHDELHNKPAKRLREAIGQIQEIEAPTPNYNMEKHGSARRQSRYCSTNLTKVRDCDADDRRHWTQPQPPNEPAF